MAFKTTIEKVWNGSTVKIIGENMIRKSIFEIGLAVEGQAKLLAPVDKGQLRGSVTTQSRDQGTDVISPALDSDKIDKPREDLEVFVGSALEHAIYQEFGTKFMNAQPYLRPAFNLVQGQAMNLVEHEGKIAFREYL
jgi:HK97 gp10 family phage protein